MKRYIRLSRLALIGMTKSVTKRTSEKRSQDSYLVRDPFFYLTYERQNKRKWTTKEERQIVQ